MTRNDKTARDQMVAFQKAGRPKAIRHGVSKPIPDAASLRDAVDAIVSQAKTFLDPDATIRMESENTK